MVNKVIKFFADWCAPCKVYAPIFEKVSQNDKFKNIEFKSYDVEEHYDLVEKYGIKSIPATIIIKENNDIYSKLTGLLTEQELMSTIEDSMSNE